MFKLSSEASLDGVVTVENKFIVEYMPYADGDHVKVYLYGLSLAARKNDNDDSVSMLARRLDLTPEAVEAAIDFWTEQGLMAKLGDDVCYFSPRAARPKIKTVDVDKYREFNRQAQLYIAARQITPNEYNNYYTLMEKLNVEWQAMVLIIKYCVDLKGDNVSYTYILTVARNLAEDGYRSADAVGEHLEEYGVYYNSLRNVMGAMGGKRPDHESIQLYKKWRTVFKYDDALIYGVACNIKHGGAAALDGKLTEYHGYGFYTLDIIEKYETEKKELYKLAKAVNKALGLYYENVDPEIAMYVKPWLSLGFDGKAIVAAAEYCMKIDLKKLSDLDAVIREFYEKDIRTESRIRASIDREKRFDAQIDALLKKFGIKGAVKDTHRAYFTDWAETRGMPQDVIDHAASLAVGKVNPFAYVNRILVGWHEAGITDLQKAKLSAPPQTQTDAQNGTVNEKYSADELNALFTQITEDDK